jgi:hypothetical protein
MGESELNIRENYFQIFFMILGLIVILPLVFVSNFIKFLRQ